MHFAKADEIMRRNPRRAVRAPRIMSTYYRAILELLVARGFAAPRAPVRLNKLARIAHPPSLRDHLMPKTVHIIGAGLSGLSAAVRLANAGCKVHVHEATQQAGGRCRSYFDAATNLTIDNGNHLLLSGNHAALGLCAGRSAPRRAGRAGDARNFRSSISRPASAGQLDPTTAGCRCGFSTRRAACPTPRAAIICALMPLIWAAQQQTVGDAIPCEGTLYQRLVQPLLLAALNIDPPEGSAGLAGAVVRETLLAGGQACRPLIARDGLSACSSSPRSSCLQRKGASVRSAMSCARSQSRRTRLGELDFGDDSDCASARRRRGARGSARPCRRAAAGPETPTKFRAIVNAHFRFDPPQAQPPIIGVVNGLAEWLFAFPQPAVGHHQRRRPAGGHAARGTGAGDLAGCLQGRAASRANCRPGRSCASGAPHSRPRRSRMRGGRARSRPAKTCFSPATGPIPGCRRPSRERSGRATAPPISCWPCAVTGLTGQQYRGFQ